jgi:hypothetical protein
MAPHLSAGPALRVRHPHDCGGPEPVRVTASVARRCVWLREQAHEAVLCDVYRDPKTGEVYLDAENGKVIKSEAPRPKVKKAAPRSEPRPPVTPLPEPVLTKSKLRSRKKPMRLEPL